MRVLSVLLWALSASVISLQAADAQEPGPIVFSEIMWMGSGASSADEWIELYNRGDRAIDLSGWTITRAASDGSEQAMVTIEEGSVEPGQTFLIASYAADSDRSHLATPVHCVSAAVFDGTRGIRDARNPGRCLVYCDRIYGLAVWHSRIRNTRHPAFTTADVRRRSGDRRIGDVVESDQDGVARLSRKSWVVPISRRSLPGLGFLREGSLGTKNDGLAFGMVGHPACLPGRTTPAGT